MQKEVVGRAFRQHEQKHRSRRITDQPWISFTTGEKVIRSSTSQSKNGVLAVLVLLRLSKWATRPSIRLGVLKRLILLESLCTSSMSYISWKLGCDRILRSLCVSISSRALSDKGKCAALPVPIDSVTQMGVTGLQRHLIVPQNLFLLCNDPRR
uniref:Uncharacterized protein n=1 Tax=Spongospora subterranea TaxID=70186 RepID=A0A0H5RE85_9EUKA|eukprot:CRZ12560.1 hypothetical protein [Spongospora subterranea]